MVTRCHIDAMPSATRCRVLPLALPCCETHELFDGACEADGETQERRGC